MKEDLLKYKKQLILGPFFKLLEAVFELLIPTLMVNVIDRGVASGDQKYIIGMGLLMLGIARPWLRKRNDLPVLCVRSLSGLWNGAEK